MSLGKIAKSTAQYVFRRIRGRVIRIKVNKVELSDRARYASHRYDTFKFNTKKTVNTMRGTKQSIGRAMVIKDKKALSIVNVKVNNEFRNQGIGHALFRKIVKFADKQGLSRIDGTVVNQSQLKIRSKYPTKFFVGDRLHGHEVSYKEATKYLKSHQVIDVVTDVNAIRRNRKIAKALTATTAAGSGAYYYKRKDK